MDARYEHGEVLNLDKTDQIFFHKADITPSSTNSKGKPLFHLTGQTIPKMDQPKSLQEHDYKEMWIPMTGEHATHLTKFLPLPLII